MGLIKDLYNKFFKSADPKEALNAHLITMETPRLILREHKPEDITRIHEISQCEGFDYYCLDGTREKAEEFIKEAKRTQKPDPKEGRRQNHMLAITMKDTGEVIGHTCLERVHYVDGADYEVNFFVDPACQNKGYGLEAILNLTHYAFETYDLKTITVTTRPDNKPSQHLIEKEGYTKIASITMDTVNGPEPRELFILQKATFYEKRAQDKRPILLSQVGNIPEDNKGPDNKGQEPKP